MGINKTNFYATPGNGIVLEGKNRFLTSYEEKVKDKKTKNDILNRWRNIGLLDGLKKYSKTEENVAEGFERMSIFLLNNETVVENEFFNTVIFPIIRLIYTGEKSTGQRLKIVLPAEKLYDILNTTTFGGMFQTINNNTPKSKQEKNKILYRLLKYKGLDDKTTTTTNECDCVFSPYTNEENILTALFCDAGQKFDLMATIVSLVSSYIVFKVKTDSVDSI